MRHGKAIADYWSIMQGNFLGIAPEYASGRETFWYISDGLSCDNKQRAGHAKPRVREE